MFELKIQTISRSCDISPPLNLFQSFLLPFCLHLVLYLPLLFPSWLLIQSLFVHPSASVSFSFSSSSYLFSIDSPQLGVVPQAWQAHWQWGAQRQSVWGETAWGELKSRLTPEARVFYESEPAFLQSHGDLLQSGTVSFEADRVTLQSKQNRHAEANERVVNLGLVT